MFKSQSYNVKKESEKNEKKQPQASNSTGTLKKQKEKKKASAEEIKQVNNKESPEYSRKIYPKKTVTQWQTNKTYSAKKLERK